MVDQGYCTLSQPLRQWDQAGSRAQLCCALREVREEGVVVGVRGGGGAQQTH